MNVVHERSSTLTGHNNEESEKEKKRETEREKERESERERKGTIGALDSSVAKYINVNEVKLPGGAVSGGNLFYLLPL